MNTVLTPEETFSRYSLQCLDIRLRRHQIVQEDYDLGQNIANGLQVTPNFLRKFLLKCFPKPITIMCLFWKEGKLAPEPHYFESNEIPIGKFSHLDLLSDELWTIRNVHLYWWRHHHYKGPCSVRRGLVDEIRDGCVICRLDGVAIKVFNRYKYELNVGGWILIHRYVIAELDPLENGFNTIS